MQEKEKTKPNRINEKVAEVVEKKKFGENSKQKVE